MTVLYGIKNCDTVKKARRWLDQHGVAYRFHDFRVDGVDEKQLALWVKQAGWEMLLNRCGTSWRALSETQRACVVDDTSAVAVMIAQPALIKRPVLESGDVLRVGFAEADYAALLKK